MPSTATIPPRPIACQLSEIDLARRRAQVADELVRHVAETRELPDGFAVRLPGDDPWLERVVAFVAAKRRCCPFFHFGIDIEPDGGPIWLTMRGEAGVKDVVAQTVLATTHQDAADR